jgi:hypothetical protein
MFQFIEGLYRFELVLTGEEGENNREVAVFGEESLGSHYEIQTCWTSG